MEVPRYSIRSPLVRLNEVPARVVPGSIQIDLLSLPTDRARFRRIEGQKRWIIIENETILDK